MSSRPSPERHREPPALRREATPHHAARASRTPELPLGPDEKIGASTVVPRIAIMRTKPHPEPGTAVRHASVFRE
jgi:hypothetical protein